MATKILVIDDDLNICDLLQMYLEKEGYEVRTANDGVEGVNVFKTYEPDMVLLDIMLPKKDGWQICREIREQSNKPIIMITAKGETIDKVLGLELGADDFIVKPLDMKEVFARIKAVLRRYAKHDAADGELIKFENLEISKQKYELKVCGKAVDLPTTTVFSPVTSFWIRFGDLIIWVTAVRLTFTLKDCVKSWRVPVKAGCLRPSGA